MRALTLLAMSFGAALGVAELASCDTGGEPPEAPDARQPVESSASDVHVDNRPPPADGAGENSNPDAGDGGGPCGLSGNACCTGDVAPCSEKGTSCKNSICQKPCGANGGQCCLGDPRCNSVSSVCSEKGFCTACGGAGDPCCAANTCASGGCCVSGICTPPGSVCAGADGAVCMSGACGSCGGPGSPCCSGNCTAPETVCQGSTPAVDAGEGGGGGGGTPGTCAACGGQGGSCCPGASCATGFACTDAGVCLCAPGTCEGGAAD